MNWSFWRRRDRQPAVLGPPAPAARPALPRDWSRLPPLRPTVQPRPPTLAPVRLPPDIAGTRPLLRPLPPLQHPATAGRVTGIAREAPPRPVDETPIASAQPTEDVPRTAGPSPVERRTLPAVERPPHPVPELTQAVDEYLGEPRVPAIPHRSTAKYDRMVDTLRSQAESGHAAFTLSMFDGFDPTGGGLSSVAAPPEDAPAPTRAPDRSIRRHTLAQTRKLGLRPTPGEDGSTDDAWPDSPTGEADEPGTPDPADDADTPEPPRPAPPPLAPTPARTPRGGPTTPTEPRPAPRLGLGEPLAHPPPKPGVGEPLGRPLPRSGVGEPLARPLPKSEPDEPLARPLPKSEPDEPLARPLPKSEPDEPLPRPLPKPEPGKPLAHTHFRSAVEPEQAQDSRSTAPPDPPPSTGPPPPAAHPAEPPRVPAAPRTTADPPTSAHLSEPLAKVDALDVAAPLVPPAVFNTAVSHPAVPHPATDAPADPPNRAVPPPPSAAARTSPPADTAPVPPRTTTPTYRAALDAMPPRVPDPAPQRDGGAIATVSVPGDVASTFRTHFGVEVGAVAVHRGPAVSRMAGSLAARAFTRGGDVYLPDELGDLSGQEARGLLAHELVHATQQRMLGGGLPSEDSAQGRELEEVAVATEQWFQGTRAEPPALIHRPAATADELAGYLRGMRNELAPLPSIAGPFLQRARPETATHVADELRQVIESGDAGAPTFPVGTVEPPSPLMPETSPPQAGSDWLAPVREPRPSDQAVVPVSPVLAEMAATTKRIDQLEGSLAELTTQVAAAEIDVDSPRSMDALADRLYRHVRSRLRYELIIDRERSGRLTDFR